MFLTHQMNHWSRWDFCETRFKQNLNHRQDNDSTSAVAIKFGWMSVTHLTPESLSSFLFIYGLKLSWLSTFIIRNVKMRMITINKHDIIGQHHHMMNVGGWVSHQELSAEITFPILKGPTILQDNAFCKMSSLFNHYMGSWVSNSKN